MLQILYYIPGIHVKIYENHPFKEVWWMYNIILHKHYQFISKIILSNLIEFELKKKIYKDIDNKQINFMRSPWWNNYKFENKKNSQGVIWYKNWKLKITKILSYFKLSKLK